MATRMIHATSEMGGIMGGQSDGKGPVRITAHWHVPKQGPSGAVEPTQYSFISSFDIDWLNTPGFQMMLDNLAASAPGAFKTVRVMKALNSGTVEFGPGLNAPVGDSVWPASQAAPSFFLSNGSPGPTITALIELTKRGLTPFVVLGFFPAGVYSNPYGPALDSISNPDTVWNNNVIPNWTTLVTTFFEALQQTFGAAIGDWWFEVWNEPDNSDFWQPDNAGGGGATPLQYYNQLYAATLSGIAAAKLGFNVRLGGPAITSTNIDVYLPDFLGSVYNNGSSPLQCDFISLHAKGDWTENQLPNLPAVINVVESAFSQYANASTYNGHFNNTPIINDEADMRVGANVPFYPRMTEQFPAWLTALMIASDSLTSQYRSSGTQFYSCSDNAHLELVGYQQEYASTGLPTDDFTVEGNLSFGQQRSIMMPASAWSAGGTVGTSTPPISPQDLVKTPVYNFYEVVRLLGDQHGAFVSGQQNFYPTDQTSGLFSAVTVGTASGQLRYLTWVFCVYPTAPANLPTTGPIPSPLKDLPSAVPVEVIDLPTTPASDWTSLNWVQFQIGPPGDPTKPITTSNPSSSFVVAQNGQVEALPQTWPPGMGSNPAHSGIEIYDMPFAPGQVDLTSSNFSATNVRMNQEVPLVRYVRGEKLASPGTWQSKAAIDFAPYSTIVFWLTPYDTSWIPATPGPITRTLPGNTTETVPVAAKFTTMAGDTNVVLRWQWTDSSPQAGSFFYFEVERVVTLRRVRATTKTKITPTPTPKATADDMALQFALRAAMWVDTAVNQHVPVDSDVHYLITAFSASGTPSTALTSNALPF
jgi:hypothetical protein